MIRTASLVVLGDAATKLVAVDWFTEHPLDVGVAVLRPASTTALALGLGAGHPATHLAAVSASVLALVLFAARSGLLPSPVGVGLVLGGGTANLADRILDGVVVDLVEIGGAVVVNLADLAIVVGAFVCLRRVWNDGQERPPGGLGRFG